MDEKKNEKENEKTPEQSGGLNDPALVQTKSRTQITCKNCKQKVTPINMVCPECGHYINENRVIYQSVAPATARKIKLILSVVLLAIFVVLAAVGVIKLDACQNTKNTFTPTPTITHQTPTTTIQKKSHPPPHLVKAKAGGFLFSAYFLCNYFPHKSRAERLCLLWFEQSEN